MTSLSSCANKLIYIFRSILFWMIRQFLLLLPRRSTHICYTVDSAGNVRYHPGNFERLKNIFIGKSGRNRLLLKWIREKLPFYTIEDFNKSWADGILLCGLVETLCPGSCPRFVALKPSQKVNNCRLGLRLAHQYLDIPTGVITPEEMSFSQNEHKVIQLLMLIRYKSTHRDMPFRSVTLNSEQETLQHGPRFCTANGSGLMTGTMGTSTRFYIYLPKKEIFDLLVRIEGSHEEFSCESIRSLYPSKSILKAMKSNEWPDPIPQSQKKIPFHYQFLSDEKIAAIYVPPSSGMYTISIYCRNSHINGSPFSVEITKQGQHTLDKILPLDFDDTFGRADLDKLRELKSSCLAQSYVGQKSVMDESEVHDASNAFEKRTSYHIHNKTSVGPNAIRRVLRRIEVISKFKNILSAAKSQHQNREDLEKTRVERVSNDSDNEIASLMEFSPIHSTIEKRLSRQSNVILTDAFDRNNSIDSISKVQATNSNCHRTISHCSSFEKFNLEFTRFSDATTQVWDQEILQETDWKPYGLTHRRRSYKPIQQIDKKMENVGTENVSNYRLLAFPIRQWTQDTGDSGISGDRQSPGILLN